MENIINLPEIPWNIISAQTAEVLSTFWPVMAVVIGVTLGVFVFRRARGAVARRM